MRKIKDVLRLKLDAHLSHERIAAALNISKGERLIHWGTSIGVATGSLVTRLLETRRHPEHGYRACLGLLSLAKRYSSPRLEAACVVALELGTTNSTHVRDILANGRDQVQPSTTPEWTSPEHAHVRGPGYYQ